jgi:hypothetical protein
VLVGAVDAVSWLAKAICEVGMRKTYACARKTMPTRLRRLATKAIVCVCDFVVIVWCCCCSWFSSSYALHSVMLASKSGGGLPRGPDFTCHYPSTDLEHCFLQRTSKTAKHRRHGLLLHQQHCQALGVHLRRQRQSRECDSRLSQHTHTNTPC